MSLVGNLSPSSVKKYMNDTIEKLDMRGAFTPKHDITEEETPSFKVSLLARGKFDPYTTFLRCKRLAAEASQRSQEASQAQESQQVDIKEEDEPGDESMVEP
ncbi:hypothetical protein K469DRAFT_261697 [Zopfia rhizophila CBS 207.26]|uniref:Uncharacterized protein n=1 Tax=Zopfia rhizophila CBS 207.26 TaxID=1314779 RepID=A0A6A6DQM8_9PEZI|nr:hypothetical protein K469DRAFT_261697 [Zopfia rhizophila CBS 207.26]